MAFSNWNKGVEYAHGDVRVSEGGLIFTDRNWNQVAMHDTNGNMGMIHYANGDMQLDSRTGTDANVRTLLHLNSGASCGEDVTKWIQVQKIGGTAPGTYRLYGEHNFGKAKSGFCGVDRSATGTPEYAGYYKFATLTMNNGDWKRTQALFYFWGEDWTYKPAFMHVLVRFNTMSTSPIGYLNNLWTAFGSTTVPDPSMTDRIFFCCNTPTANNNGSTNVDIYWHQYAGYDSARYWLVAGSTRNYDYYNLDFIKLYHPETPTLTSLDGAYDHVWKATDILNTQIDIT